MLDKLLLQIASDLCSFCHLGNFLGEITAGRKGNNLYTAGEKLTKLSWIFLITDWIESITDWIVLITNWIDIITDKINKKWLKSICVTDRQTDRHSDV